MPLRPHFRRSGSEDSNPPSSADAPTRPDPQPARRPRLERNGPIRNLALPPVFGEALTTAPLSSFEEAGVPKATTRASTPATPAEAIVEQSYRIVERYLEEGRRYAETMSAWTSAPDGTTPRGELVTRAADLLGAFARVMRPDTRDEALSARASDDWAETPPLHPQHRPSYAEPARAAAIPTHEAGIPETQDETYLDLWEPSPVERARESARRAPIGPGIPKNSGAAPKAAALRVGTPPSVVLEGLRGAAEVRSKQSEAVEGSVEDEDETGDLEASTPSDGHP